MVIGERFWRETLAAPSPAGLTLRLNDIDVCVAGVMSGDYTGPAGIYSPDVWLPLDDVALFGLSPKLQARDTRWLFLFGRLGAASSVAEVQGQLDAAVVNMARDWPGSHRDRGARFRMLRDGNSERRGVATGAAIGMGLIGLVLLLAWWTQSLVSTFAIPIEQPQHLRLMPRA